MYLVKHGRDFIQVFKEILNRYFQPNSVSLALINSKAIASRISCDLSINKK
jgi:hypothetical protein